MAAVGVSGLVRVRRLVNSVAKNGRGSTLAPISRLRTPAPSTRGESTPSHPGTGPGGPARVRLSMTLYDFYVWRSRGRAQKRGVTWRVS